MRDETYGRPTTGAPAYAGHPAYAPRQGQAFAHPEAVSLGLVTASVAVLGGIALTVVLWRFGFIASITSFAMALGATSLYTWAAGTAPRRGAAPLLVMIVLGVVVAFFAVVASDLWDVYDELHLSTVSRSSFILDNLFRRSLLSEYARDMVMFGLFAVLGVFSTLRRVLRAAR